MKYQETTKKSIYDSYLRDVELLRDGLLQQRVQRPLLVLGTRQLDLHVVQLGDVLVRARREHAPQPRERDRVLLLRHECCVKIKYLKLRP